MGQNESCIIQMALQEANQMIKIHLIKHLKFKDNPHKKNLKLFLIMMSGVCIWSMISAYAYAQKEFRVTFA